ncbi:MAG: polysaccharide deacetylase family protein [Motiliproteus sp.]
MRILHLLSQTHLTGAEVYAAQLCREQLSQGDQCWIVSDTLSVSVSGASYIPMPIDNRSYLNRLKNIIGVVRLCKQHQIDVIHAHSRAASWVANIAAKWAKVGYVSTVHGRQKVHKSSSSWNIYGRNIVAVCDHIADHLQNELNIPPSYIRVVRNGLNNVERLQPRAIDDRSRQTVVWIGRLTGPKGEIARKLAYEIAPQFGQVEFLFVGGPAIPTSWPEAPENVRFTGQTDDVTQYYHQADLVIGAGRVALEAMQLSKPVMAVGECCYVGPVEPATIQLAKATNFGDCFAPAGIDWEALTNDLHRLLQGSDTVDTEDYDAYLDDYAVGHVNQQLQITYQQARAESALRHVKEVPVLMFHQVPDQAPENSIHNVYVTKDRLREHFTNLKRRGFETVTFKELAAGKRVKKPIILTFDDGYEDNHRNLLPLLQEFDFKAVVYALADEQLTRNEWDIPGGEPPAALMNYEQLKACHNSGRIEVGSHGLSHAHLPGLTQNQLGIELEQSKLRLESLLGTEVVSFAYPYGDYGDREVECARAAGYLFAIATVSGPVHLSENFFKIRRVNLMPSDKGFQFWKKTSGVYLRYCKWKKKDFD